MTWDAWHSLLFTGKEGPPDPTDLRIYSDWVEEQGWPRVAAFFRWLASKSYWPVIVSYHPFHHKRETLWMWEHNTREKKSSCIPKNLFDFLSVPKFFIMGLPPGPETTSIQAIYKSDFFAVCDLMRLWVSRTFEEVYSGEWPPQERGGGG